MVLELYLLYLMIFNDP